MLCFGLDPGAVRVAIISESFPPDVNGVAHSVVRVAEYLAHSGHQPLVVAPGPSRPARAADLDQTWSYPVVRATSVAMPGYQSFRVGLPGRRVAATLTDFMPDVVHLAAPFALGSHGLNVARRMGLPTVAVYQTDVPSFAASYRLGFGRAAAWRRIRRIHGAADRTLVPSSAAIAALAEHGVPRLHLWPRGVDQVRFHPAKRDEKLRAELLDGRELLVGYVGRLAREKQLDLLARTAALPSVRLVLVGDGPARASLEHALPDATFLGQRTGDELARLYASLDVFVHTGPHETFCQAVQEALASGVPVVAPAAGGPLDLVSPGRNGFLVPPGDGAALRQAVEDLHDSKLRAAYGTAGRQSVAGRSWTAVCNDLVGHYEAVLSGRAAVPVAEAAA